MTSPVMSPPKLVSNRVRSFSMCLYFLLLLISIQQAEISRNKQAPFVNFHMAEISSR